MTCWRAKCGLRPCEGSAQDAVAVCAAVRAAVQAEREATLVILENLLNSPDCPYDRGEVLARVAQAVRARE